MVGKILYTELKKVERSSMSKKWVIISEFRKNPLVIASINGEKAIYDAVTTAGSVPLDYNKERDVIEQHRKNLTGLIGSVFDPDSINKAKYLDNRLDKRLYRNLLAHSNNK